MSDKTKATTGQATDRAEFDRQLTEAVTEAAQAPPEGQEGAESFPGVKPIWQFLVSAVTNPQVLQLLWQLWQQSHGGGTQPAPAPAPPPPPEPSS